MAEESGSSLDLDPLNFQRRSVSEGNASIFLWRADRQAAHHHRHAPQAAVGGGVFPSSTAEQAQAPYATTPLDPLVIKESYILGEVLPGGETETIEFKSGVERKKKATSAAAAAAAAAAVRVVRDKVARYLVAFLNSSGGAILFGVEDDGTVSGCALTEAQRVEITKAVDAAVQGIDPQVEVGAVRHRFAPVLDATGADGGDDADGGSSSRHNEAAKASSSSTEMNDGEADTAKKFVIAVTVRPESSRLQPAYYPTSHALESFIRRAESVYPLTPALVAQREDEFRAAGRTVRRTWRHVVRRAVDFEGHVEGLRSSSSSSSSTSSDSSRAGPAAAGGATAVAVVPRIRLISSVASAVLDGADTPRSRTVAVVGDSGTGKSTLVASLICGGRNRHKETGPNGWKNLAVCGWYFCGPAAAEREEEAEEVSSSVSAFVGHLAASLAVSHHTRAFRKFIQDNAAEVLRTIEAADPRTAFRGLLRICRSLADQPPRRLAFCLDGIEEAASYTRAAVAEKRAGSSSPVTSCDLLTIPDLIFGFASEAPPWLVFVVTARSPSQVSPGIPLVSSDEGAEDDISAFIAMRRDRDPRLSSLLTEEAALHLAEAAGSNFQFVHSVLDLVEGHGWGSSELQQLMRPSPSSDGDGDGDEYGNGNGGSNRDEVGPDDAKLRRLYNSLFRLQFPTQSRLHQAKLVLEILLAARRPLIGSDIAAALSPDVPAERVRSVLSELMAYLTPNSNGGGPPRTWAADEKEGGTAAGVDNSRVRLQHLSFRQWLLDPRNAIVPCKMSRGHARLAMWHLAQAHSLSSRIFLLERFPSSFDAAHVDGSVGSAPSRGVTALLEQEGIHHVLEAAIHLGWLSAASDVDSGIVSALRDLSGPSLVLVDHLGRSAIYFASRQGSKPEYLAALKLLLDASTSRCPSLPIEAGLHGKCPLVVAAQRGHEEAFALLVRAVDDAVQSGAVEPDDAEEAMDAALWAAASSGAVGCVALLVGGEEDLSIALQRGMVMGGAEAAERSKVCPLADSRGCTALWLAVTSGNAEAVKVLVKHPPASSGANYADVGVIEADCCDVPASPLHVAVSQGNPEIVRLLAGYASPYVLGQMKGERWPTLPLCSACILGNTACAEELLHFPEGPDSVNLASGFFPNRTALLEAVWNVQVDCVQLLLGEPQIDVLLAEEDGGSAIHEACYWGKGRCSSALSHADATDVLKMLISYHYEKNLTLDIPDADGCTPLCYAAAAEGDQAEWAALLLKKGASPHLRPWGGSKARGFREAASSAECLRAQPWGGTPLEEAATRNNVKVVATLCAAAAGCLLEGMEIASEFTEQASRLVNALRCDSTEPSEAPLFDREVLMIAGGENLVAAFGDAAKAVTGLPRFAVQQHMGAPTFERLPPND